MKNPLRLVAPAAMLAALAAPAHAQCDRWLAGPFGPITPGANNQVSASTIWDPDGAGPEPARLVVAGSFSQIGGIRATRVAAWDGSHWHPLGDGLPDLVRDLTVYNGELIATGWFPWGVARYHLGGWIPMGATLGGGTPHGAAVTVYNGQLILAGQFTSVGGVAANNIARWSGTAWQPLGAGLLGSPTGTPYPLGLSLAVFNNELIVGGSFDTAGGVNASGIARWNGAAWQPLGAGVVHANPIQTQVRALAVYGGGLVAGGIFTSAGGQSAVNIARWSGSAWQPLGAGVNVWNCGAPPMVDAMAVYNGALIVGGNFAGAGGVPGANIARWNGSAWSAVGGGVAGAMCDSATVRTLAVHNNQLAAGGTFETAAGAQSDNLARWNGSTWAPYYNPWFVYAFAQLGSRIVAGGYFAQPTGPTSAPAYHIASWNGVTFTAMDGGMNHAVLALKSFTNPGPFGHNELIAGGSFTAAGGTPANRVARWLDVGTFPPPEWEPMGAGFDQEVYAIERCNGETYAGGDFSASGTAAVNHIARWDGTGWQPLDAGCNGPVMALRAGAVTPTSIELIAGGAFTAAGAASATRIARWSFNPQIPNSRWAWSAMGAGFNGTVRAIARHNGATYAAGDFTASGTATVNRIARWTGSAWAPLGTGLNGPVYALHSSGNDLYAAGVFTTAGGAPAVRIARWDGTSWSEVRGGADNSVFALAPFQGEVHAGGGFGAVGNPALASPGWARYTAGAPWIALNPSPVTTSCGQAAVFNAAAGAGYTGLQYRWRRNNAPLSNGPTGHGSTIAGATTPSLTVSNLAAADAGSYDLVVSTSCGSDTSAAATLTVNNCVCYANCDGSATAPVLNVNDFICFQSRFAAGDPWANCDGSTTGPALNVNDFICFQSRFAAGCP